MSLFECKHAEVSVQLLSPGTTSGEVAILKTQLAYGRIFLSRCVQAYFPFIHCCDPELMTMDSGSDSVWAKDIDDVSEHSDIDDD